MIKEIKDIGASVRARLLNLSHKTGRNFDQLLTLFVLERILFRISKSRHSGMFVLKGGILVTTWLEDIETAHRPTRDIDLLGFIDSEPNTALETFREILADDGQDGIEFDLDALRAETIRETTQYGGIRLTTKAFLGGARVPVTVDIGFGDDPKPAPEVIDYPSLLDFEKPQLKAYTKETVLAEKFHGIVLLGAENSRMKDYYDFFVLGREFSFDNDRLAQSIAATFNRRNTKIPTEVPIGLSSSFAEEKQQLWRTFVEKAEFGNADSLSDVVGAINGFIMPHSIKAANGK